MQVLVASLLSKNDETSCTHVEQNRQRAQPPDNRITKKIDLSMILDPEAGKIA